MKCFISTVLAYDPKHVNLQGGILGLVKGYYGCVEAQGRGTLHCHMLIWVEGGLNPNEIRNKIVQDHDLEFKQRLLSFLDDCICNKISPPSPDFVQTDLLKAHPCSIRGIDCNLPDEQRQMAHQQDLRNLVCCCQKHSHSKTCFKYWKGPPAPKECRFDLDEKNTTIESTIDEETGDIKLRHLDGMVNNFNATILECVRCNMDIKFIGSGESAKAVLFYITDYITKSQMNAHVSYSALKLAIKKLGEFNPNDDNITVRAKRLLQKCSFEIISHQELSAQQVSSYLQQLEDHFTSHEYCKLYWTTVESMIEREDPSPECY
ncbi:hypothetical protein BKA93DRAFT_720895, partial [Sparassis latifolia]